MRFWEWNSIMCTLSGCLVYQLTIFRGSTVLPTNKVECRSTCDMSDHESDATVDSLTFYSMHSFGKILEKNDPAVVDNIVKGRPTGM